MSGLTYDRSPYTAAQLNTIFNDMVTSIKYKLPPDIRVNSAGDKFDDITITEGDDMSLIIQEPADLLRAIATLGTSNFAGAWMVDSVFDNLTNVYSQNQKRLLVFSGNPKPRTIQIVSLSSTGVTQYQNLVNQFSGADFINTPPVGVTFNQLSTAYDEIPLAYMEYDFTSVSALTLVSNLNIVNTGLGWYSNNYSTREEFEGRGYSKWGAGVGTTISSMYLDDTGYSQWFSGNGYLRGTETFSIGWPEGLTPSKPGTSTSCGDKTEDISTQIGAGLTMFSISEDFVTDSLHVYWNGQRQPVTEVSSTQFITSFTPLSGDSIIVDYCPNTETA